MYEKEKKELITRMKYNSKDLGELGTYVKLEYAINFINDTFQKITDKYICPFCKKHYIKKASINKSYPDGICAKCFNKLN